MCTQPKGPISKSEALETALNNKLLSSPEHLKKVSFLSPPPVSNNNNNNNNNRVKTAAKMVVDMVYCV